MPRLFSVLLAVILLSSGAGRTPSEYQSAAATPSPSAQQAPPLAPIDPQRVQDQQDMTWEDYRGIPGHRWADPSLEPARKLRVALVAIDFDDQPFVITLPRHSDPFGNPQIDPVPRAQVPRFYADFFNTPSALNHGQTINGFWMEQSRGRVGIPPLDSYGPYRMPKKLFQYGLNEFKQGDACPGGFTCDGRMERDADALWTADAGQDIRSKYDIVLRIYAGYDETSVWQEFGEMKFASREDIPSSWGNPDPSKPRWVITRYVPWTSWKAGQMQWGLSSVRQGESSGTITHEIAHFAFKTGDNNNNPYVTPYRRVGSGPWDIMDRGSFNGPGGPHRRWVVPPAEGAAMPAGFMLRNRLRFEFVPPEQVLRLNRTRLAESGLAVARVAARAIEPAEGEVAGITVTLDGDAPQDRTPTCDMSADPLCAGEAVFNFYSIEVVQRIGYDSFTPDNGVLIAKNKDREGNTCGYNCFTWVIDAHPEDINLVDFVKPDGARVMRTAADYRQLNDALFHAGLRSGSEYEWEDAANRLHFYVVDVQRSSSGVLSYVVGVRSLDGRGSHTRGVRLQAPARHESTSSPWSVRLTNTGKAGGDAPSHVRSDIYRLSVAAEGEGWSVYLQNALAAVPFGESTLIPVYVTGSRASGSAPRVTLTVVSESDLSQRATVTASIVPAR
jgi:M6 family metalloprotease-like protein